MKLFTKAALVSAMAMSANAMAMQALDDSTLSKTTGQDGISITIDTASAVTIDKVFLHDTDGLSSSATFTKSDGTVVNLGGTGDGLGTATSSTGTGSGAIVINNINISKVNSTDKMMQLVIDTDGGKTKTSTGDGAFLNIGINLAPVKITTGAITVTKSGAAGAAGILRAGTAETTILNKLSLNVGATTANIQLGNTPQGAMILVNGTMTGGLSLGSNHRGFGVGTANATDDGLSLHDAGVNGGGDLVIGQLAVASSGSKNWNMGLNVDITPSGLALSLPNTKLDVAIDNLRLGAAGNAPIGDLEIQGLNTGGTSVFITGH